MSEVVLVDAQFGLTRVLKPFEGFEQRYQGADSEIPIAFPGVLAAEAGEQGFDPDLLRGMPVPLGAQMCIWIPQNFENYLSDTRYQYQVIWRLRSAADYRDDIERAREPGNQSTFHIAQRRFGALADPNDPTSQRFVLPAASQTLAFTQPEPATATGDAETNLRGQQIVTRAGVWTAPIAPPPRPVANRGVITQGIFPIDQTGGSPAVTGGPVFNPFWFDVEGDEIIIMARRLDLGAGATWDFNGVDREFSNTYGTDNGTRPVLPEVGIYVMTGSNP